MDAGVDGASVVPMAYDPLVAKICTWGTDRAQAIRRMRRALAETAVLGITTNTALHERVLRHADFVAGNYDTALLSTPLPPTAAAPTGSDEAALVAAALERFVRDEQRAQAAATGGSAPAGTSASLWRTHGRGRVLRGG
jgi:acetyl/propionyl-CoA carboxylase alpha subunit